MQGQHRLLHQPRTAAGQLDTPGMGQWGRTWGSQGLEKPLVSSSRGLLPAALSGSSKSSPKIKARCLHVRQEREKFSSQSLMKLLSFATRKSKPVGPQ